MFQNTKAFSGYAVRSIPEAKKFYGEILGLKVCDDHGMLVLNIAGGGDILLYENKEHVPASFAVLNFPVADIKKAALELEGQGLKIDHHRSGVAWFRDPSGNFLSLIQDDSLKTGTKIHLTKFIPEECSEVYRAWLDPSAIELWSIPDSQETYIEHFEPVKGGQFLIQHETPRGIYESSGRFLDVKPNERLHYELDILDPSCKHILRTIVSVEFIDEFSGTNVILHQEGFEDTDYLSRCEKKWHDSLDKLHYVITKDKFQRPASGMQPESIPGGPL